MSDEHKVKIQSPFRMGKSLDMREVTLTCTCGKEFTAASKGSRSDIPRIERMALRNAETAFREHLPIR